MLFWEIYTEKRRAMRELKYKFWRFKVTTLNSNIVVTDRKQRRPKAIVRRDSLEVYFVLVNFLVKQVTKMTAYLFAIHQFKCTKNIVSGIFIHTVNTITFFQRDMLTQLTF